MQRSWFSLGCHVATWALAFELISSACGSGRHTACFDIHLGVLRCTWACLNEILGVFGAAQCVSQLVCCTLLAGILRFCGDVPSGELPTPAVAVETAQKLLHQVGCSMPVQPNLGQATKQRPAAASAEECLYACAHVASHLIACGVYALTCSTTHVLQSSCSDAEQLHTTCVMCAMPLCYAALCCAGLEACGAAG
jgi:hypothetical protein